MSAKWMRIETDFVDHPKVLRLAAHLGSDEANAGWYVMRAWSWMSRFCPTGQVRDIDGTALESACKWSGARGALVAGLVAAGFFEAESDGFFEAHDWAEHQGRVAAKAEKERERKRAYRLRKAGNVPRDNHGTDHGTDAGRPAQRDVTGRDVTYKEEPSADASGSQGGSEPPQLELVGQRSKAKARPAPDPKAEFARFAASLTPDEGAVFEAYEKAMGVELGADWQLRKFVAQKLVAHPADELCAAIRGHLSDSWRREKSSSLRAVLRDASHIATMAKLARGAA